MLGKNSGQIDVFDHLIFEKLIPKDHLLVKIDSIVDFEASSVASNLARVPGTFAD